MIRVVLDTNVIVSGLANFDNLDRAPARVLRLILQDQLDLISSGAIIREVSKTLSNPYFVQRVNRAATASVEALLLKRSLGDNLTISVQGVASHPEDDLILATALSAAADVLVTGDRMLLKLGSYEGVAIMSPSDFLAFLESQE